MTFYEQVKRIERIDYLIRIKSTGTPSELADKLGISRSQLYQIIKIMKEDFDAPVRYSRARQCYYYLEDVKFVCAFTTEENVA